MHNSKLVNIIFADCSGGRFIKAARFRVQKCANNQQLIVAGIHRFLRHICAAHFRMV